MKIQYDPSLLDEVVLREIRQREEKGDLRPLKKYHALVRKEVMELRCSSNENGFWGWGLHNM